MASSSALALRRPLEWLTSLEMLATSLLQFAEFEVVAVTSRKLHPLGVLTYHGLPASSSLQAPLGHQIRRRSLLAAPTVLRELMTRALMKLGLRPSAGRPPLRVQRVVRMRERLRHSFRMYPATGQASPSAGCRHSCRACSSPGPAALDLIEQELFRIFERSLTPWGHPTCQGRLQVPSSFCESRRALASSARGEAPRVPTDFLQ